MTRRLAWLLLLATAAAAGPVQFGPEPPPPLQRVSDPPNEEPEAEQPEPETTTADYFGNSLPSLFGGQPYSEFPLDQPQADLFRPGFGSRDRLQFSGFADLSFTLRSVSGSSSTFSNDQFGYDDVINENASLLVAGPLWKWANLNVHAQIEQRSFGFNDTRPRWQLYWQDSHNRITLGDITPRLGDGNQFISFQRSMRGLEATGELPGHFQYLVFGSQVQSTVRSETFAGDGTPGPYFLTYTPIEDGSAVVLVDGIRQQPGFGDTGDYTLNPSTGELLFNGTRIIPPTSRIEVTYETLGTSGPKDLLMGMRIQSTPWRGAVLGASFLGQFAASGGGPEGPIETRVTDEFVVPTASTGPFTIRPRPIVPGSESVQVSGVLQERDIDYEIVYDTGELRFFQILPEGTPVLVRFSVIEDVDLGAGDRTLWGLDGSFALFGKATIGFQYAASSGSGGRTNNPFSFSGDGYGGYGGYGGLFGSGDSFGGDFGSGLNPGYGYSDGTSSIFGDSGGLDSFGSATSSPFYRSRARNPAVRSRQTQQPSGSGGQAFLVTAATRLGDFAFNAQYKSVSDGFSRIDTTGFYQNETGMSFAGQYSTGQRFSISHQWQSFSRPFFSTTGTGDDAETVRSTVRSELQVTSLNWRYLPDSTLTISRNAQTNGGGGSSIDLERLSFNLLHRFSRNFSAVAAWESSHSGTTGVSQTGSNALSNDGDTTGLRAGLSYQSTGGGFGARLDYRLSDTSSSFSTNRSSSTNLSVNWSPWRWASMQFTHTLSDSSNETLVGRPGDTTDDDDGATARWLRLRQTGVGAFPGTGGSNIPTDPLTGGNINTTATNSNLSNTSLSLLLTPLDRLSLSTTYSLSNTDTGRLAGSETSSWQMNLNWQLSRLLRFDFGYSLQGLRYSDTGDTTDTNILNFGLDWDVSRHLNLRLNYQVLGTNNAFGPRDDDEPDPSSFGIAPTTSFGSWGLDARWALPGAGGHSLFMNLRGDSNSAGGGANDFSRLQFRTGFDYRLTDILSFRTSYDLTSYSNATEQQDNGYTAHVLQAGVGARF